MFSRFHRGFCVHQGRGPFQGHRGGPATGTRAEAHRGGDPAAQRGLFLLEQLFYLLFFSNRPLTFFLFCFFFVFFKSVLYLREIPNKPPPPYTPPGQSLNTWKRPAAPSSAAASPPPPLPPPPPPPPPSSSSNAAVAAGPPQVRGVPRSRDQVSRLCRRLAEFVLEHDDGGGGGGDPAPVPDDLLLQQWDADGGAGGAPWTKEGEANQRAYLTLLADLTRQFVDELRPSATFLAGSQRPNAAKVSHHHRSMFLSPHLFSL